MKTTLPKARDAARLAEKVRPIVHTRTRARENKKFPRAPSSFAHARYERQIITLGKRGTYPAWQKASGFLLQPSLAPKVFETLATRYAQRPGGYTRIHKYGRRQGDNAPHAVVELVDGPKDLKFEMAARAAGWDVLSGRLRTSSARALVREGVVDGRGIEETVEVERALGEGSDREGGEKSELRQRTRWNLQKALRYRSAEDVKRFGEKVQGHMVRPPPPPPISRHSTSTFAPALFSFSHRAPFRTHSSRGHWP